MKKQSDNDKDSHNVKVSRKEGPEFRETKSAAAGDGSGFAQVVFSVCTINHVIVIHAPSCVG